MSWRELAPEPARCWIRLLPKRWPAAESPYLDLAERRIAWPGGDRELPLPELPTAGRDLVYLPPVARERRSERERWLVDLERSGGMALLQVDPDEALEPAATGWRVTDLLPWLLTGEVDRAAELPTPIAVALPLIAGLSARPSDWTPWLAALARDGGGRSVFGITVDLTPTDRRRLAEVAGDDRWQGIFHADPPAERDFARAAAAVGLRPFAVRPSCTLPPRLGRNRELATLLASTGELWLRLGRSEADGQALLAAARHVEATPLDVAALAREKNLAVIGWLSPRARALVEERVATGSCALLETLEREWTAPPSGSASGGEPAPASGDPSASDSARPVV